MTAPGALSHEARQRAAATTGSRRRLSRGVVALLIAAACLAAPSLSAAFAIEEGAVDSPLGLQDARCPVPVPETRLDDVSCGWFTVPERRVAGSDPERTLRLPVVVIRDDSRERVADALVVPVSGEADGSALGALSYFLAGPDWVGPRDVVLVDMRGDLHAEPSLDCPEVDGAADVGARLAGLEACRERLLSDGIDLAAYTSAESAADLAGLRIALGYGAWNVYGVSEGSRLAMTLLRDQPAGLRSVILDGAFPPDIDRYELLPAAATAAVETVLGRCRADRECRTQYPDIAERLEAALERSDREPLAIVARDPATGAPVRVPMDADAVAAELVHALAATDSARVLPYVIDRLAEGDADAALPLVQRRLDTGNRLSEGRALSIECAEELPFHDPAVVAAARATSTLAEHLTIDEQRATECAVWAVPAADAREALPVTSAVPTLLLAGEHDPAAPPAWSDIAAAGLSRSVSFTLPHTGHAPAWHGGCAASLARQFLDAPATAPKAGCIDRMPPTSFLSTADIDPTASVSRLRADLRTDPAPAQIGVAVSAVLLFVGTLGYGAAYAVRRRWDAPAGAVFAAVSAASLNLVFVGLLAVVLANADPLVLSYGLPSAAWPLLLLPFAALACALVLVGLLVRAWMTDDGGLAHRVILTVSALGTLGFAVWLFVRGLLTL